MRFPVSLSYTKSSLYINNVAKINYRTLGIYVQYVLPDMHVINEHNYISHSLHVSTLDASRFTLFENPVVDLVK